MCSKANMLGFVVVTEIDGMLHMREIDHHVDVEDLESYSIGTSSPADSTRIEEHLLVCECCQDRLQETDDYVLAVRRATLKWQRDERASKRSEWRFAAWFPPLAALACCLMLVVSALHLVRQP